MLLPLTLMLLSACTVLANNPMPESASVETKTGQTTETFTEVVPTLTDPPINLPVGNPGNTRFQLTLQGYSIATSHGAADFCLAGS